MMVKRSENYFRKSITIVIVVFLVCFVQIIKATGSTARETGSSSGSTNFHSSAAVDSLNSFISKWNEVNMAIEIFISNYQSQHKVVVNVDRQIVKTEGFEVDPALIYRTFLLKFTFLKDGENVSSSVMIQIPHFGPNYPLEQRLLFHEKEKYMYEKVLPLMHRSSSGEKLWPNFYASTNHFRVLILENLRVTKFYKKSNKPLTLVECESVFRMLAQFHALSTLHLDEVYAGIDSLTVADRISIQNVTDTLSIFEKFRKFAMPLLPENVKRELDYAAQNYRFLVNTAFLPNLNGFNVIVHGNVNWMNLFFQDQETGNFKCKLVDFQNSRRGSPVIDLVNFLMTSVQFEVYQNHSNALFRLYVDEFKKTLEKAGASNRDTYGLDKLRADLRKYRSYFLGQIVVSAPLFWTPYFPAPVRDNIHEHVFQLKQFISLLTIWVQTLVHIM